MLALKKKKAIIFGALFFEAGFSVKTFSFVAFHFVFVFFFFCCAAEKKYSPTTETRQYRRRVVMLGHEDQTPVSGSYRSTLLRQDAPSKPPHTYSSPWLALTPRQLRFVPSDVTVDHLLKLAS